MTIDRRTFLLGTGLAATVPALASLLSLPAIAQRPATLPPEAVLPASEASVHMDTDGVAFGIEGWTPMDSAPAAGLVLITVNQSWRSAWR